MFSRNALKLFVILGCFCLLAGSCVPLYACPSCKLAIERDAAREKKEKEEAEKRDPILAAVSAKHDSNKPTGMRSQTRGLSMGVVAALGMLMLVAGALFKLMALAAREADAMPANGAVTGKAKQAE